jgi:hypothetical protein
MLVGVPCRVLLCAYPAELVKISTQLCSEPGQQTDDTTGPGPRELSPAALSKLTSVQHEKLIVVDEQTAGVQK